MATLSCTSESPAAAPALLSAPVICLRNTAGRWWHTLLGHFGPSRPQGLMPPDHHHELTPLGELFLGCSGDDDCDPLPLQPVVAVRARS